MARKTWKTDLIPVMFVAISVMAPVAPFVDFMKSIHDRPRFVAPIHAHDVATHEAAEGGSHDSFHVAVHGGQHSVSHETRPCGDVAV